MMIFWDCYLSIFLGTFEWCLWFFQVPYSIQHMSTMLAVIRYPRKSTSTQNSDLTFDTQLASLMVVTFTHCHHQSSIQTIEIAKDLSHNIAFSCVILISISLMCLLVGKDQQCMLVSTRTQSPPINIVLTKGTFSPMLDSQYNLDYSFHTAVSTTTLLNRPCKY